MDFTQDLLEVTATVGEPFSGAILVTSIRCGCHRHRRHAHCCELYHLQLPWSSIILPLLEFSLTTSSVLRIDRAGSFQHGLELKSTSDPICSHLTNSIRAIWTELDFFYTQFHHIHCLQNIINVKYISIFTNIYKIF